MRVPSKDPDYIKGVLDMGADGVIIPMVNTVEEALAAAAATHYPPDGVVFGTAGVKLLSSKDAKKVYTNCTAAVLRAKDCVMKTATTVQENAEDILAEAQQINEKRAQEEAMQVQEDDVQEDGASEQEENE